MHKEGNFVETVYGPGVILDMYEGRPDNFLGATPTVYDILAPERLMIALELRQGQETTATPENKRNILSGIFDNIPVTAFGRLRS